jgi:DNA-3-methyladenine glycosylase
VSKLPRSFYERAAEQVSKDLLGKVLARSVEGTTLRGRIVEVEAYSGQSDPGSHAFRGPTPRNRVMFGPAGYTYVYISYGMHACMNVVTDPDNVAGAVLIRALEPLDGIPIMEERRRGRPPGELSNGPGKLCQALGITRAQNGTDLEGEEIWIEDDGFRAEPIATSTRVGLSNGRELPLRFFLPGNTFVSPGKPS